MLISVRYFSLSASCQIQDHRAGNANYFYAHTFKNSVKMAITLKRCLFPLKSPIHCHNTIKANICLFPFAFFFQVKFLSTILFSHTNRRATYIYTQHAGKHVICNPEEEKQENVSDCSTYCRFGTTK